MPITFSVTAEDDHFVTSFVGPVADSEMIASFDEFLNGPEWSQDLNELADLSNADLTSISPNGIRRLADFIERFARAHDWVPKVAVYAPHDLPYGLARIYSVAAERFETHRVFKDKEEALAWLADSTEEAKAGTDLR